MPRPYPLFLLLLAGCPEPKDSPPALVLSAEGLVFGEVPVNTPATQTVTLTNDGGGEVELLSVSLIEGAAAVWVVDREDTATLAGGESMEISVTFSPSTLVAYEGRVQVRSDDPGNPNLYVSLTGTGAPSTADNDGDGYSVSGGDCDDASAEIHPGADERCNGRDDDCDGNLPVDEADGDSDGWLLCEDDCDDLDGNVYPGAPEICDEKDSDCDGTNADRTDSDGDGYTICDDDCDDDEPLSWPGNPEVCDEVDNDCDGDIDTIDADRDGHSVCGAAGDCDDDDPAAYPVVVDDDATGMGSGTEADPYPSLDIAFLNLDSICRTIQLDPGSYEVAVTWSDGYVRIGGGGLDPSEVILTAPAGSRHFEVTDSAELALANLTLQDGTPTGDGGAVRVVDATCTMEGVVATGNTSTGDGGAVAVSSGVLIVMDSTFEANVAQDDGGAIAAVSGSFSDVGSRYTTNQANRGGALQLDSCSIDIADSEVTTNVAADQGGGIELIGGTSVVIERVTLYGNTSGATGGGISVVNLVATGGYLRNNLVRDNEAAVAGGGIAFTGTDAGTVVANNTVLSNTSAGAGAGIYVDANSAGGLYVWSNIVGWSDGASGVYGRDTDASFAYNLAYSTTSGTDFDLGAAEDQGENEVANPLFRSYTDNGAPDADDLSLASGSPARNSGPTDGEGPPTYTTWSDPDGSRNDRGYTGGPGAE